MNDIFINYGTDPAAAVYELMSAAAERINVSRGMNIVLKPNLVVPRPNRDGATTHSEIAEGVVRWLTEHDVLPENITVAEGSWIGVEDTQAAFDVCGYTDLAKKYGFKLFDTKADEIVTKEYDGLEISVCKTVAHADYLINLPVLKGHCQTGITCCLKNLKGCIPDSEKQRFHTIGLHAPIAALNTMLKPDLHIVDGICGDLDFEGGGNPVVSNRMMLGFDPVLLDSFGARLLGYAPEDIEHVRYARDYGVGQLCDINTRVLEMNTNARPKSGGSDCGKVRRLSKFTDQRSACSACYAALIYALDKFDGKMPREKICIGQDFRGQNIDGIGVGSCTAGFSRSLPGCPPTGLEMLQFLKEVGNCEI